MGRYSEEYVQTLRDLRSKAEAEVDVLAAALVAVEEFARYGAAHAGVNVDRHFEHIKRDTDQPEASPAFDNVFQRLLSIRRASNNDTEFGDAVMREWRIPNEGRYSVFARAHGKMGGTVSLAKWIATELESATDQTSAGQK